MLHRLKALLCAGAALLSASSLLSPSRAGAQAKGDRAHRMRPSISRRHRDPLVAYDAKDRRYYSVAYARAHGMKDRGGDTLTLIRRSRLPKNAKMSHAMKGKM